MRTLDGLRAVNMPIQTGCRFGCLVLAAVVAITTASCDVVATTDPLTLQAKTVSFRFEFDSEGIESGETVEAQSVESVDMGPILSADGFTKAEVLSATITSVELERISPANVNLDFLEQAELAFTASGMSRRSIASSASLPASRDAPLSIANSDVMTFVVAPTFRAVASVVPATVPQAGFVLRANVTLRIRVEGV